MSYNGIGLSTARGSGTNGFIQKNTTNSSLLTAYERRQQSKKYSENQKSKIQKDKELIKHENRRAVEVKASELRDKLEDENKLSDEEIDKKVEEYRQTLIRDYRFKYEVQYVSRSDRKDDKLNRKSFKKDEETVELDY